MNNNQILEIICQFNNPYQYINANNLLNKTKIFNDLRKSYSLKDVSNEDLLNYIDNEATNILTELKDLSEVDLRDKFEQIDLDEFISKYKDSDKKREEFIYNTKHYVRSIINDLFSPNINYKKLSNWTELYSEIYGKIEIYKENITCNRQQIETQISKLLPNDLTLLYPQARQIKRHFKIICGPTNSGKTFEALEELKQSYNGIYLGPLRLLAYEKYTEFMKKGIMTSLITGEEEIINSDSRIQCSTVEMCDLTKEYDCLVLDEAQLCTDSDRGCYWTKIILGSVCKNIIICCAPEIVPLLKKLIEKCNDTYEIIKKDRLVPLKSAENNFNNRPQDGDAYIVFSRKEVHQLANELRTTTDKDISILYGNLPYKVRQNEAEKFNSGETNLLVATDCIGMGLNLPIKRIVLMETDKYDGTDIRQLTSSEVKQIIGRAGRYNKYDLGLYTSQNIHKLENILKSKTDNLDIPFIDMPKSLLKIKAPIKNILSVWNNYNLGSEYRKSNISMISDLCSYAEKFITDRKILWSVINFKFDYKDDFETNCFAEWKNIVNCLSIKQPYTYKSKNPTNLLDMEEEYKIYDLVYQYYRLVEDKENLNKIIEKRNNLSTKIMKELDSIKNSKKWLS